MTKICYIVTIPETIRAFFVPQIQYLSNQGYDVSVICSPDPELQNDLGSKIHYFPISIPRGISLSGSIKALRQIRNRLKTEGFSLVQYSTPNASLYASIAATQLHIPVRNYHLMGLRYLGEKGIKRRILYLIEKLTCKLSTSIECVSQSNLILGINERLFTEAKAVVVWNGSTGGIDLQKFNIASRSKYRSDIRTELHIEQDTLVYGFVGRITRDKGIIELLEAFLAHERNAVLLLIGGLEDEDILNNPEVIEKKQTGKIKYVSFVNDIEKYYCAIDVLILPSYREGFGNVIIEAAAMGTPAIVSRIPGPIDAVIEGKTALVVPVKDSKALSVAMDKMENSGLRNKMGQIAAEFSVGSFDSEELCKRIKQRKDLLLNKY